MEWPLKYPDQLVFNALWWRSQADRSRLFSLTEQQPVSHALMGNANHNSHLSERLRAFSRLVMMRQDDRLPEFVSPFFVWDTAFGISQWLRRMRWKVLGIAGPAGVGKTTLAQLIVACMKCLDPFQNVVRVSLDDFHLTKGERRRRGMKWRATPGSHDIGKGHQLLKELRSGRHGIVIPRYRSAEDDIVAFDYVGRPATAVVFEGWFVGTMDYGYDVLRRQVDCLLYLDCPMSLAKARRFSRAYARLAKVDRSVYHEERRRIDEFWDEVLEPGNVRWVEPVRAIADVVVAMNEEGDIMSCVAKDGYT